jgi:hypothetical protein
MGVEVKLHTLLTLAIDGDGQLQTLATSLRKGAPQRVDPKVCLKISMNTKVPILPGIKHLKTSVIKTASD